MSLGVGLIAQVFRKAAENDLYYAETSCNFINYGLHRQVIWSPISKYSNDIMVQHLFRFLKSFYSLCKCHLNNLFIFLSSFLDCASYVESNDTTLTVENYTVGIEVVFGCQYFMQGSKAIICWCKRSKFR